MVTLECGSGLSTLLFDTKGCEHISLEHYSYHMSGSNSVILTKLTGNPLWYDWIPSHPFDLIFIDGPAEAKDRFGILRVLRECLHGSTVIVLDDTNRIPEQQLREKISKDYNFSFDTFDCSDGREFTVFKRNSNTPHSKGCQDG